MAACTEKILNRNPVSNPWPYTKISVLPVKNVCITITYPLIPTFRVMMAGLLYLKLKDILNIQFLC